MCRRAAFPIKSVSPYGVKYTFVPCGSCAACISAERMSWRFRLRAEFDYLATLGYWCGFATLTYRNGRLPHIPYSLVQKDKRGSYNKKSMPPCFSKVHARDLINTLRKWIHDNYMSEADKENKVKKFSFFLASEFGEHTQRPHYHVLFCVHPDVPSLKFFDKMCSVWKKYGFVIPKDYEGGEDKKLRKHKPFLVDNLGKACGYVAKYVTKDLKFYESIKKDDFYKKLGCLRLANYLPFHIQTRSLGINFILSLDEETKLKYLNDGFAFVGDDRNYSIPIYFRNKLVFDTYYEFSNGKRLVRRRANKFFEEHFREIFDKKVYSLTTQLDCWLDGTYWIDKKVDLDSLKLVRELAQRYKYFSNKDLATLITAYYGVSSAYVVNIGDPARFWLLRYQDKYKISGWVPSGPDDPCCKGDLIDPSLLFDLSVLYSTLVNMDNESSEKEMSLRLADLRHLAFVNDFHKS